MKRSIAVFSRVLLGLLLFLTLVPFYLLIVNSFKWSKEIVENPFNFAEVWRYHNYGKALDQILRPMINSGIVTVSVVIIVLVVSVLGAYAFTRFTFKGSKICYLVIMAMLMIPGFVLLIPQFIQVKNLGLYNTYAGLILPPAAALSATATFLLRTAMDGLPKSLFEAADMEGATDLQILTRVVLPLSKPTVATVIIMTGLNAWNNYLWPLVSTTGKETQQITVALTKLIRTAVEGNGVLFAGYVVASLPLVILFCFASKAFVAGLTQGAVKG